MNVSAAIACIRKPSFGKVDNVLEEEHRRRVWEFLSEPGWSFGWKSDPKKDPYGFWHKHFAGHTRPDHYTQEAKDAPYDCVAELKENAPLLHEFWLGLEAQLLPGHRLTRCYANGQPYGCEGSIHTDSVSQDSKTIVYYPHSKWHPNWGGETVFFNDERTDIVATMYPRPNRLVLFSGTIPHVARGVSRVCPSLRITLMFKAERVGVEEKYRSFLVDQLRVNEIRHSGRDFYAHLCGTYELLKSWGNPESVCLAGLFHSIYGTWHFRHRAFPIEKRETIRELIGDDAESLAYAFCVIERPKHLIASIKSTDVELTDHSAKSTLRLSRSQIDCLLEIEAANLLEQQGNVSSLLAQIADANISSGAKAAIANYLSIGSHI